MTEPSTFAKFSSRLRGFIDAASSSPTPGLAAEKAFTTLAMELFSLQFAGVPSYRRFCEARNAAPNRVQDWRDVPAIPTTAFKDFDLTSLPVSERARVFHSSGTTEQRPSRHFHSVESIAIYEASLLPWFAAHLLPGGPGSSSTFIVLTPPAEEAPHSSLVHMFATLVSAFSLGDSLFAGHVTPNAVWELDLPRTLDALSSATANGRPVILLGTAFNFVHLLDHLEKTGAKFALPDGSRVLETGGYKGRSRTLPKPELHRLITRFLGIAPSRIVCEYGMSELSSQAYDRIAGDAHGSTAAFQFPPWACAQVVSPETGREVADGETGLLRVFDLANVRSVLAIQTEDLAIRRGDRFELIGRAAQTEPRGCSLMSVPG